MAASGQHGALEPSIAPADEPDFELFTARATGRAGQVLLVITASLMVVLWPIDGHEGFDLQLLDLDAVVPQWLVDSSVVLAPDVLLVHERHGAPVRVIADHYRVLEAIQRLLADAATSVGEGPGTIWLRCGTETIGWKPEVGDAVPARLAPGPYAVIEVRDDGTGFPADERRRMLDPLVISLPASRRLGLLAVTAIVRAHRGALIIDELPAGGTRVRMLLPQTRGPLPTSRAALSANATSEGDR